MGLCTIYRRPAHPGPGVLVPRPASGEVPRDGGGRVDDHVDALDQRGEPIQRVGVIDVEAFYPAKDRFELAMSLNNLLASPGFESWLDEVVGLTYEPAVIVYNRDLVPAESCSTKAGASLCVDEPVRVGLVGDPEPAREDEPDESFSYAFDGDKLLLAVAQGFIGALTGNASTEPETPSVWVMRRRARSSLSAERPQTTAATRQVGRSPSSSTICSRLGSPSALKVAACMPRPYGDEVFLSRNM